MDTAIEIYAKAGPLKVQPHVIERAVRALAEHDDNVEALALIRGAYADDAGVFASLAEARLIFASIVGRGVEWNTHIRYAANSYGG
jgi:hypothetical protein